MRHGFLYKLSEEGVPQTVGVEFWLRSKICQNMSSQMNMLKSGYYYTVHTSSNFPSMYSELRYTIIRGVVGVNFVFTQKYEHSS